MIKMTKEGLLQTRQRGRRLAAIYTYWISTILLSLLYLSSAYLYLTRREWVQQVLGNLGYSAGYLVPLMIVVKILGPVAILSRVSVPLSDLAYAGIFYHLLQSGLARRAQAERRDTGRDWP